MRRVTNAFFTIGLRKAQRPCTELRGYVYSHRLSICLMTSSNGNIYALLALCEGNPPVTGGFPAQRLVTRSFNVLFDQRLNKRLSKQSWGWWFEMPLCSLWRHHGHCNGNQNLRKQTDPNISTSIQNNRPLTQWGLNKMTFCRHLKINFLQWENVDLIKFQWSFFFYGSNWKLWWANSSDNGFASNRRLAITWTNAANDL